MKIGYARVSKLEQNLDVQLEELKREGCEKIVTDKLTGSLMERPGLNKVMEFIRPNDILVVCRLDRLGRSTKHLIEFVTNLQEKQIGFKSLGENIDTTTASGKLIFHIFCSLAEFERNILIERTKKSLEVAKSRGRCGGRKKKLTEEQATLMKRLYKEREDSVKTLCETFDVSIPTFYKYIRA